MIQTSQPVFGTFCSAWPVLLGALFITGCSKGPPVPKLVPVSGKVMLDGAPLPGASVLFVPKNETKGTGGIGVTDASGHYEAHHMSNKTGIQPGTYRVLFSKIALPDGSPIPSDRSAADMGAVELLPPELSRSTSDLAQYNASVTDSGGTFDFELASK